MKVYNYELDYNRLKELRLKYNLTQKDVAKVLDISASTYSHYENADFIIPIKQLNILANYFNVSLDYLVNLSKTKNINIINKELNKNIIAARIKETRLKNKLYQETLAKEIGTSKSLICEYEKGKKLLSLPYAYAICRKYNVSMDWLYGKK